MAGKGGGSHDGSDAEEGAAAAAAGAAAAGAAAAEEAVAVQFLALAPREANVGAVGAAATACFVL